MNTEPQTIPERVAAALSAFRDAGSPWPTVHDLAALLRIRPALLTAAILESGALVRFRDAGGCLRIKPAEKTQKGLIQKAADASTQQQEPAERAESAECGKKQTSEGVQWPFAVAFHPADDRAPDVKSGEKGCGFCRHGGVSNIGPKCDACNPRTLSNFEPRPGVDMARRAQLTREGIANTYPPRVVGAGPALVTLAKVEASEPMPEGLTITRRPYADGRSVTNEAPKWADIFERLAVEPIASPAELPTVEMDAKHYHAVRTAIRRWNERAEASGRAARLRSCCMRKTDRMLIQRVA